jgi:hypothetical protein
MVCDSDRDAIIDTTVPSLAGAGLVEAVSDITGLARGVFRTITRTTLNF